MIANKENEPASAATNASFIAELRQEKGIVNKYLKVFKALIEDSEETDDVQL